jgi:UDP-2,3-diacylglucosamine hydrolase
MAPKLGIIAGSGLLPKKLVEKCRETGRDCFVLALEGETDPACVDGVEHVWSRMGAAAKNFAALRQAGVQELVMVGGVRRPSLVGLRPDWRAAQFFARIGLRALGDDGLLSAVVKELEKEGFALVGVESVLSEALAPEGPFGRHRPDPQALADIEHGFNIAAVLGALDIGQAVIVQQGMVLGVEAIEGTDELIRRCAALRRDGPGGVLVKTKKPNQERRADLPTIGPQTVEAAHASGLRGIAVEAWSTLVIEREEMTALADRLGLFVFGRAV